MLWSTIQNHVLQKGFYKSFIFLFCIFYFVFSFYVYDAICIQNGGDHFSISCFSVACLPVILCPP